MNSEQKIHTTYLIGFLIILALLGFAAYLEVVAGVAPCPLCIIQRCFMGMLGTFFFIGAFLRCKKLGYIIISFFSLITSILGILFSGRQVWLQHFPITAGGECGISLAYMFKIFPFFIALKHVWHGGVECSEQGWVFLHLSIAEWSLIWFGIFFLLAILQLKRSI
jgi:disulfide bond formation protein DsbB